MGAREKAPPKNQGFLYKVERKQKTVVFQKRIRALTSITVRYRMPMASTGMNALSTVAATTKNGKTAIMESSRGRPKAMGKTVSTAVSSSSVRNRLPVKLVVIAAMMRPMPSVELIHTMFIP